MKVKDLIKLLQEEDPERLVIIASDAEGNDYNEFDGFWTAAYDKKNREVGLEGLTEELIERGYSDEDVMEDGIPALVFSPC